MDIRKLTPEERKERHFGHFALMLAFRGWLLFGVSVHNTEGQDDITISRHWTHPPTGGWKTVVVYSGGRGLDALSPVAWKRWKRAIVVARVIAAFRTMGRSNLLRNVGPIIIAAFGGTITEVPEEFVCPITRELFDDPVVAADGVTYERRAIERHLQMNEAPRSPMTNLPLAHKTLLPNTTLRKHIRETIDRGRKCLQTDSSS